MSLADYKAAAKATVEEVMCSGACDAIPMHDRMLVLYNDDAVKKAAGAAVLLAFDTACNTYKAQIDLAISEAEVDAILGSVVYPQL